MLALLLDAIRQHVPVIVIDLKGDPTLAARLQAAAASSGLAFGHFSITPGGAATRGTRANAR